MAKWNPARLFSSSIQALEPALKIYRSDEAALDAVKARKKPICFFSAVRSELAEWQELAFARGLALTVTEAQLPGRPPADQPLRVFIARPEELWRVPALLALWHTALVEGVWSDAVENQMSYLLGYTAKQRAAWLAARRRDLPAWSCATVYALLDDPRRGAIEAVGRRCFGAVDGVAGLAVFHRANALKASALSIVPKQHTLARVGVSWPVFDEVFPRRSAHELTTTVLTARSAAVLYEGLASNVQFLTRSGWR